MLCHVFGLEALAHDELAYVVHVIDTPPQRVRGAGVVDANEQGLRQKQKSESLEHLLYKVTVEDLWENFTFRRPLVGIVVLSYFFFFTFRRPLDGIVVLSGCVGAWL